MFCHDFVRYFEEQNPGQQWCKVEERIFSMLSSLLKASTERRGDGMSSLTAAPQSRAMYAVDLMLQWTDDVLGTFPSIFIFLRAIRSGITVKFSALKRNSQDLFFFFPYIRRRRSRAVHTAHVVGGELGAGL